MTTGYGSTYITKRENIVDALRKKGIKLHHADIGIVVAACIEGMEIAFDRYSELNDWFKTVATAAVRAGRSDLRWYSPNGSLIVQDYRHPIFTRLVTHAASGGHYSILVRDQNGSSQIKTGVGDPNPYKHASGIAANFTHTLDACMIQDGVNALADGIDVVTVHDCCYGQPGYMANDVVPHFRRAFHNVTTTPVLESLLEENELEDTVHMIQKNEVDLSVCLESPYLFC